MQVQSRQLISRVASVLHNGHSPGEVSIGVDRSPMMRASDRAILVSREVSRGLEECGIDCQAISVVPQFDNMVSYSVVVHKPRKS